MQKGEKYESELRFRITQARRWVIRRLISGLVRWEPLASPVEGYTVIVGCNVPLARMISCNLGFLARQDLRGVDRVLLVLDRPRDRMPDDVEPVLRSRFPTLPLEFLYYSPRQRRVCDLVGWPWVQSWLSWSLGIAAARTRYGILHDFDAMLLRPDILAERYRAIRERGHDYVGVRCYEGNGVLPDDGLVTTFELAFDAASVRRTFDPIDLFNQVTRFRGRRVDFDTFLYAQTLHGVASTLPIPEEDLVHPSQLICQFEDFRLARRPLPASNGLLLIPYFLLAGGEPDTLRGLRRQFEDASRSTVSFFGRELDFRALHPEMLRWLAKQAARLDVAATGGVRQEVLDYFTAIDRFISRTTGRPLALEGGPAVGAVLPAREGAGAKGTKFDEGEDKP